jgi:hypothetical protein
MTSAVQGETLVYHQGEQQQLIVSTAPWFVWSETASAFP